MKLILIALITLAAVAASATENKNIVCYVGTWATYRTGKGKFDVEHIDPNLCTHLMYSFFGINDKGEFRVIDAYLDLEENWGKGNIKKFNALKQVNPKLKTLAAVGGWNEGSIKFSEAAKDPIKRRTFIETSIEFALKHNFDGIDMDWEYPAQRGGDVEVDKANFVIWMKEFKEELEKHGLILTTAVAAAEFSASQSYDIPNISKYFDLINIMAYDLHGTWDETTGINAPLYPGPNDVTVTQQQLNVHSCVQYWLKQGAPAHKIVLGVPLYGRTFALANAAENKPGSRFYGPGQAGPYTRQAGFLGYNEICDNFKTQSWTQVWESTQQVPYAFNGNQWVGYDDVKSIELKTRYANKYKLGGIMVWSLETDDFNGVCGEKYPLMKAINRVLGDGSIPPNPPTTQAPITDPTTAAPNPTPPPGPEFKCTENGTFRDPYDCAVFYICNNNLKHSFRCADDLWFDIKTSTCNFKNLVDCKPLPIPPNY
ncbi:chitinase-3-like protein 1 [Condylostylus longicornis]|uniref:chitinase-3-like protein 1 n=1 Tax=Condylostylus longicornis TaxID=2530218 RepID=UPI00244DDB27|nr:chitinase-3-like protein 1 [Condylostylus longicornis]